MLYNDLLLKITKREIVKTSMDVKIGLIERSQFEVDGYALDNI